MVPLTIEKLEQRARDLEDFRFVDMRPITPMESMEGHLGKDEVYTLPPANIAGGTLQIGDLFEGRGHYLWAEKTVQLPPAKPGAFIG